MMTTLAGIRHRIDNLQAKRDEAYNDWSSGASRNLDRILAEMEEAARDLITEIQKTRAELARSTATPK